MNGRVPPPCNFVQARPAKRDPLKTRSLPLFLYALTIFLSAFLLFQVQPIIARIILPWFGGSAAVWTVCLLFFQLVLLLGYLYAHGSIRYLPPLWQRRVHITLLVVSVLTLHVLPAQSLRPQGSDEPTAHILLLLLLTIGLPYFLLSTTSPLLQAWYDAHIRSQSASQDVDNAPDERARSFPYRLYALSNAGSLLALLSYPVLIEPRLLLRQQAYTWQAAYVGFVVLCVIVALRMRGNDSPHGALETQRHRGEEEKWDRGDAGDAYERATNHESRATNRLPRYLMYPLWIVLAFCSSTLLLAISNHLSQNVAAIPFLWIVPLSLYLLSFIWCFGPREWVWRKAALPLPLALIAAMAYALSDDYQNLPIKLLIPLFSAGLFACCMLCHGELARLKPPPRELTAFYLMISIGGALGGVFVGLLAPRWFSSELEMPIGLGLCALIALLGLYREPEQPWWEPSWLILAALTVGLLYFLSDNTRQWQKDYDLTVRNFYGVLRVNVVDKDTDDARRILVYGTIQHGAQYLDPKKRDMHISYYGPDSGIGLAIRARADSRPERVGTIGLGTGTIASYGRPGDVYRYYEINPLVKHIAQTQFTYLKDCKAQIDVVMGDARLSIQAQPDQHFDVLAVDAFSSDAIPIHLLTKEAFELYFRSLKPDGILAVHVSNRFLKLAPVVASIAQSLNREAYVINTESDESNALAATEWVLVSAQHSLFKTPLLKNVAHPIPIPANTRVWTDDYSNLFQTIRRQGE